MLQPLGLERDVVVLLEVFDWSGGSTLRRAGTLGCTLRLRTILAARASATGFAAGEELQVFADDFQFAAFLTGGLVIPGVEIQTAFDVNRIALCQVLLRKLCLAAPERDIDEGGFLLFLALFVFPDAVDREAEFGDGGSFGRVAQFGIPCEIPDEHDFVEICHTGKMRRARVRASEFKTIKRRA